MQNPDIIAESHSQRSYTILARNIWRLWSQAAHLALNSTADQLYLISLSKHGPATSLGIVFSKSDHQEVTIYGPSGDVQKREVLYQVIQDAMRSERAGASHAGLPQPYNIMAGDVNAALFKADVQRTKLDRKDTKHQNFIRDTRLHTTDPEKHLHRY